MRRKNVDRILSGGLQEKVAGGTGDPIVCQHKRCTARAERTRMTIKASVSNQTDEPNFREDGRWVQVVGMESLKKSKG